MNQHQPSMTNMHGDGYSKSGSRTLPRSMGHDSRRVSNKGRDMSCDHTDMDSSRPSLSGNMYPGMYGNIPGNTGNMLAGMADGMPQGMYQGMVSSMTGYGMPRMMDYSGEMPRRFMDRQERPMDMMYGRYMDMSPSRYMSSQERLMHMMQSRHLYPRKMDMGRMGERMSMNIGNMGNMDARGRHMEHYN